MRVPNPLVRYIFEPLWDIYERSIRLSSLRKFRKTQYLSQDKIEAEQAIRLRGIVEHAYSTIPFYRQRFLNTIVEPDRIQSLDELQLLPILTRRDLQENSQDLVASIYRNKDLALAKSDQTQWAPQQIFCDNRGIELHHASFMRFDEWAGWQMGEPIAGVISNPSSPESLLSKARAIFKDRRLFIDACNIDQEAIFQFNKRWGGVKPTLLIGHASNIMFLAEKLMTKKHAILPRRVVATNNLLNQPEREKIEDVFQTNVMCRYSTMEMGIICSECEECNGMHVNSDTHIVEIIRDNGAPCHPGEIGNIVVTDTANYAMPLIRFDIGGKGQFYDHACGCGRGLPMMKLVKSHT